MIRLVATAPVLVAALALLLLSTPEARALESAPVRSERATATLVTDTDAYAPGKPFHLGLRLRIAPGWHTYWQNPGDAGAPPELSLTLPAGAQASAIAWPAPVRQPEGPLMTYAYTGEVLLPVTVTPPAGGGPVAVEASANWLVCAKICVPEEGHFRLDIPAGPGASAGAPSAEAPLFAAAASRTPRPSPFDARVAPDGTLTVSGQGLSAATVREAWFFPAAAGALDQAAPQRLTRGRDEIRLSLTPGPDFAAATPLQGVLVLRDPGGAESVLQISAPPGDPAPPPPTLPLGRALFLAFLGGLILNAMPCVFPVLAMKALALARLSGRDRAEVRAHALSYSAGVLLAFGTLGLVLLGLRSAGAAAGWGFQFQSPALVALMAWLLFGVGLNLSGVFEVAGGRAAGAGSALAGRAGHLGSFFTGLLAVVVATPCTAPFMGAAVAAGLAAPAPATLGVFLALGAGMAAPWALLAAVPRLTGLMPRPGPWMATAKGILAFPMYAACVWLAWVVAQEAGPTGVLGVGTGLVLLGFAGWALGQVQRRAGRARSIGHAAALAASLAALAVLPGLGSATPPAAATETASGAEPFSAARLAALRAEGRPVFVNMTASWCVTCLVNERVALSATAVRDAFAAHGVTYLKGDWTRQDPGVTEFLRAHGRDGVPLYVFFPPHGTPVVLPQILTAGTVLDEVRQAGT